MSLQPEPSPAVDAAGLPADPTAYRRPGSGLRWGLTIGAVTIWTVFIAFAAFYIAGQGKISGPPDVVQALNLPFVNHQVDAPPPATPVTAPVAASTAPESVLDARVERLEGQQRRSSQAAASALAAATLAEAAQSAAPFDAELATIGPLLPPSADLAGLQRLSRQGAPTRAALAAEFTETVTRAASAAREPAEGAGALAKIGHSLSRIVTIRRVNGVSGFGSDAILSRAQRELTDGDLEAAAADLDKLNAPARKALAGWRDRAQRRLDIDHQVGAIRTAAMRDLSASAGGR